MQTDGPRILVIDDEIDTANFIKTVLEDEGYSVEIALSGPEGIDRLKGDGFEAVTLDIIMPEMDGWEVLNRIRGDENLSDTDVVVFSVLETKDAFDMASKMGVKLIPKSSGHTPLIEEIKSFSAKY